MININDKCCGCEACSQICPQKCISLRLDKEGFLYPRVEKENCLECGLCQKVCPVINSREPVIPIKVWAAQNKDDYVRRNSSSGGIVTMLAEKIIDIGGAVYGVVMNDKCEAIHTCVENKDNLYRLQGSKYIQSRIGNSFKEIQDYLQEHRAVLFIGTPCQVSALKHFLGKEYDNLYTVDFICHGVPSPGIFKWYLQEEVNNLIAKDISTKQTHSTHSVYSIFEEGIRLPRGLKISNIYFRNKRKGWKEYTLVIKLEDNNGDKQQNITLYSSLKENPFLKGFISDLYLRPSCHKCVVRKFRSGSDLTVADFWGQEYMFPEFDNDTGTSCVIIKTKKGNSIFSSLNNIKKEEKTLDQVIKYNPSLLFSKRMNLQRKKFWRNVGSLSFNETYKSAQRLNIIEKIITKLLCE